MRPLMDRSAFQKVVDDTVEGLPPQFKEKLAEVVILIEDYPEATRGPDSRLLGLYEGVPITEWGHDYSGKLPDTITLYQGNIEDYALDDAEIPHVIRETLLHEIAHHFGFDHDVIHRMERRGERGRS